MRPILWVDPAMADSKVIGSNTCCELRATFGPTARVSAKNTESRSPRSASWATSM